MKVEIIFKPSDVVQFVDTVRDKADRLKESLGFLPASAY
jgi:hypothetical protein